MSVVDVAHRGATAVVTLNRPQVRNAIDGALITDLRAALAEADADPSIATIVLTGADPAFCAGIDLKALERGDAVIADDVVAGTHRPWPLTSTPVIGAVNGAAVTGGLELALACDLLIASERAFFADTHARVGIMPSWELSVRLPAAVGRRTATWMSLTGNPLSAARAEVAGLVSEVCPHDELLDRALAVADDIGSADRDGARALLGSYRLSEDAVWAAGFEIEDATSREWLARPQRHASNDSRERLFARNRDKFAPGTGTHPS